MWRLAELWKLATGRLSTAVQLDGWGAYENMGALQSIADAFVASTIRQQIQRGIAVDPNAL